MGFGSGLEAALLEDAASLSAPTLPEVAGRLRTEALSLDGSLLARRAGRGFKGASSSGIAEVAGAVRMRRGAACFSALSTTMVPARLGVSEPRRRSYTGLSFRQ